MSVSENSENNSKVPSISDDMFDADLDMNGMGGKTKHIDETEVSEAMGKIHLITKMKDKAKRRSFKRKANEIDDIPNDVFANVEDEMAKKRSKDLLISYNVWKNDNLTFSQNDNFKF